MITKSFFKNIEDKILVNLIKTKVEIKIAVAWFTNPRIFDVLKDLINKGVLVELILCDDEINFKNPRLNFQKMINSGMTLNISKYPFLMHNKFCIIDNRILITGSYNWTLRAEQFNYENIILSTDKELIINYSNYFDTIKDSTVKIDEISGVIFRKYNSPNELDFENSLNPSLISSSIEDLQIDKKPNNNDLEESVRHAEILYNQAEHYECIEYCEQKINEHPNIATFHIIQASSYWRIKKFKKLISSAKKAISLDNESYEAYNLLGIGCSNIKGKEQESIKYYNICLSEFPEEHSFLRNRAIAYYKLCCDLNISIKLRDQYEKNGDRDLQKLIHLINNKIEKERTFSELHSLAISHNLLGKERLALIEINNSLNKFNSITDKLKLDKNELLEIKDLQSELKKKLRRK